MKSLHLINQQLEQLPAEQGQAVSTLIDLKMDNDMDKVLQKLNVMQSEIALIRSEFETKFTVLMWLVGGLIVLVVGLFTSLHN